MRVAVMVRQGVAHDFDLLSKFARGVQAYGDAVHVAPRTTRPPSSSIDAVACWGWRQGSVYRRLGFNVLCFERGYVGDRFTWTSVGLNGLNGRATFVKVEDGGERWDRHFAHLMQPWQEHDGYALLMGQVPTDTAVREIAFPVWLRETARALRNRGERVCYRPHPLAPSLRCDYAEPLKAPLQNALSGAGRVVTFNSNSGVDAILAGVPTVAIDAGSMAYPVATHSIKDAPSRPDRRAWAHAIAWAQWQPQELESGEAWSRLRNLI